MRICGEGIDDRLDAVVKFEPFIAEQSYLSVIHPNNTIRWITEELSERLSDGYCRGILLVKGVARAGISEDEFHRLKEQYGNRFHVPAYAVGTSSEDTRLYGARAARFAKFFEVARAKDVLDWEILDPPWPEAVVSAYLLVRAMLADDQARSLIEKCSVDWEPIWEQAKREYNSVAKRSLNSSTLARETAEAIATQIGEYLANVQFTCDLSRQRGRLRHVWLKNEVLPMTEDFIVLMRTEPSLREARESFEPKIQSDGEFVRRLQEAREFVGDAVDGFDPGQLVDSGPLSKLQNDARNSIRSILRQQYLRQTSIAESCEAVTEAINDLALALREFSAAWYEQPTPDETLIKKRFTDFHARARALQERLGSLPEGIVLP